MGNAMIDHGQISAGLDNRCPAILLHAHSVLLGHSKGIEQCIIQCSFVCRHLRQTWIVFPTEVWFWVNPMNPFQKADLCFQNMRKCFRIDPYEPGLLATIISSLKPIQMAIQFLIGPVIVLEELDHCWFRLILT